MDFQKKRVNQQEEVPLQKGVGFTLNPRPQDLSLEPRRGEVDFANAPTEQETQGVYIISVAARLLDMHPQTLRKYERLGLVHPSRTVGMLRLYSVEDLDKVRLIRHLEITMGMNLAGVEFILNLLEGLVEMQHRIGLQARMQALNAILDAEMIHLFDQLNLPVQRRD
jgi:DNA-binding transcriptional MerR regulator